MKRRGFTLLEMLVVLAMIAVLMGSMGTAVVAAKRRARISKASQEVHEITNAILAYEQYAKGRTLANYASSAWKNCTKGSMRMILGGDTGENGETIPILFNAELIHDEIRDPWGIAYQFKIESTGDIEGGDASGATDSGFMTAPILPNFFRLAIEERGL